MLTVINFDIPHYFCAKCLTTFCAACLPEHPTSHKRGICGVVAKRWQKGSSTFAEEAKCSRCPNVVKCRIQCCDSSCGFVVCKQCVGGKLASKLCSILRSHRHSLFMIRPPHWTVLEQETSAECPCRTNQDCISHCERCCKGWKVLCRR